jgi:hypothetical protein
MTEAQRLAMRSLAVLDRARAVVAAIAAGAGPATLSPTARALLTSSGRLLQLLEIAHHAQHDPTR